MSFFPTHFSLSTITFSHSPFFSLTLSLFPSIVLRIGDLEKRGLFDELTLNKKKEKYILYTIVRYLLFLSAAMHEGYSNVYRYTYRYLYRYYYR